MQNSGVLHRVAIDSHQKRSCLVVNQELVKIEGAFPGSLLRGLESPQVPFHRSTAASTASLRPNPPVAVSFVPSRQI